MKIVRFAWLPAFITASCLLLTVPGTAQSADGSVPVRMPGGVAISPDGTTVAWSAGRGEGSQIHLTEVANPASDKIVTPKGATDCSSNSPLWSPDGLWLAYTSTCTGKDQKPGQAQIFLWSRASGQSRQLTHVTGLFKQAAWSPDGESIAFLFVENATRSAGALDAMKPWDGVIGEDNVEVQGVYGVDVATGKGAWLIPATPAMYTYEFAWAPNSQQMAFIGAPSPGENNWWVAKLLETRVNQVLHPEVLPSSSENACINANGRCYFGDEVVVDPAKVAGNLHGLQIAVPRWSPDGKRIAFIGGLMSDQGSTGGDVWVVDANGGQPVDITPGIDGTPVFEAWVGDGKVGFVENRRGHIILPDYDVATHTLVPGSAADLGEVSISGGAIQDAVSFTPKGIFAFAESSFSKPPEVWAGPLTALKQITHLNDGAQAGSKVQSMEWDNEGFHVQGWLRYPKDYDPAKKYPLIVTVHGGPSAAIGASWNGVGLNWSELGYFAFEPNPRGSFGQGEAFTQANRKDFGYGDLRDILKGMDTIEAKYPVDKDREGITGWSYGGFMTMFAVTQTHRFRAAVAGAGLSDWLSYYGENSIDQWMIPFFGASVYDDPAVYAKSSAITYIKNAKTPMLIIVGDRDGECPAPQSFEMWHALRDQGVKTQLVVYPNEGHGFRDPKHIEDRNERMEKWFAENMKATDSRH